MTRVVTTFLEMNQLIKPAKRIGNAFLNFVYPGACFHCGIRVSEQEVLICDTCWRMLPRNTHYTISSGDKALTRKKYFSFVAWRFGYDDAVRELIHFFKFNNYSFLHERFGFEMAYTLLNRKELSAADALVPVPLHRARMRERGYNQSLLLANTLSENTGIPVIRTLERIKNNRPQATIEDKAEKERNVIGVFAVKNKEDINGKRIVLVDDIFTTGATSNECGKILKQARAKEVMVLTTVYAGG